MSPALEMQRLAAVIEAREAELQSLRAKLTGWEQLARSGADEVSAEEAARFGLVQKILEAKRILEDF